MAARLSRQMHLSTAAYVEEQFPENSDWLNYAKGLRQLWENDTITDNDIHAALNYFEMSETIHAKLYIHDCYGMLEEYEKLLEALEAFRRFDEKCDIAYHYYYAIAIYKNIYDENRIRLIKKSADKGLFYAKRMLILSDKRPFKKIRLIPGAISSGYLAAKNKLDLRLL